MTNHIEAGADKASLRKTLSDARKSLDANAQAQAASGLLAQLQQLTVFQQADKIALYLAHDGEIDPIEVMAWAQRKHRHCYLPVTKQQNGRNWLVFAEVRKDTRFVDNRLGIAEPAVAQSEMLAARALDLVLLPLVGFDRCGNRIGMGGGFYDTTLEFLAVEGRSRPALVGIAHELQKVDKIAAQSWDVRLSTVVTDKQIYRLSA